MISFILVLILPLMVQIIPLVVFRKICNTEKYLNSGWSTFMLSVLFFIISILTIVIAISISLYGLSYDKPQGAEPVCATGVATFVMTGIIMTIIITIHGLAYTYSANKREKNYGK